MLIDWRIIDDGGEKWKKRQRRKENNDGDSGHKRRSSQLPEQHPTATPSPRAKLGISIAIAYRTIII